MCRSIRDRSNAVGRETTDEPTDALLLAVIEGTPDEKLTVFALRLALTHHKAMPRDEEIDFLAEAKLVFNPPKPVKAPKPKNSKAPTPIKPNAPKQKKTGKKQVAA